MGADLIGNDGLEITPDKRELSPKRNDAPESADATRVAGETRMEEEEGGASLPDEEASPAALGVVQKALGEGGIGAEDSADEQRAGSPLPSSEAALTASPSPETRVSGSSPASAEKTALASSPPTEAGSLEGDDDGAGVVPDQDDGTGVPLSEEEPAVGAGGSVEGGEDQAEQSAVDVTAKSSGDGVLAADSAPGDASDVVRTGQEEQEEEEKSEKPALDAVVEPSVASGVRQEGEEDAGVVLGAGIERGGLDPSQEEVCDVGRGEPAVPEADEKGAKPSEAAGVREQDGATVTLSSKNEAGSSSGSDADDSTGGSKEAAAETELSREMGRGSAGSGLSPLVVEAEEVVSAGEDTQSVVVSEHGKDGPEKGLQNGLQNDPLGSNGEQGGGGSVVVANGAGAEEEAQVPVFEEIEL